MEQANQKEGKAAMTMLVEGQFDTHPHPRELELRGEEAS
jgi:hypothetical protein